MKEVSATQAPYSFVQDFHGYTDPFRTTVQRLLGSIVDSMFDSCCSTNELAKLAKSRLPQQTANAVLTSFAEATSKAMSAAVKEIRTQAERLVHQYMPYDAIPKDRPTFNELTLTGLYSISHRLKHEDNFEGYSVRTLSLYDTEPSPDQEEFENIMPVKLGFNGKPHNSFGEAVTDPIVTTEKKTYGKTDYLDIGSNIKETPARSISPLKNDYSPSKERRSESDVVTLNLARPNDGKNQENMVSPINIGVKDMSLPSYNRQAGFAFIEDVQGKSPNFGNSPIVTQRTSNTYGDIQNINLRQSGNTPGRQAPGPQQQIQTQNFSSFFNRDETAAREKTLQPSIAATPVYQQTPAYSPALPVQSNLLFAPPPRDVK